MLPVEDAKLGSISRAAACRGERALDGAHVLRGEQRSDACMLALRAVGGELVAEVVELGHSVHPTPVFNISAA